MLLRGMEHVTELSTSYMVGYVVLTYRMVRTDLCLIVSFSFTIKYCCYDYIMYTQHHVLFSTTHPKGVVVPFLYKGHDSYH